LKASRLLSVLMLLQTRGRLTACALAEELEVSERTILRDIDQLSAAGVPVWGDRGRCGGFQIREGWRTQLTGMTEPEATALMLAGMPLAAKDLGVGAAAASARFKLLASLPSEWQEQADRVGARLYVDPVDWYRARDESVYLKEVAQAVWHGTRIKVMYKSWRGPSKRELDPLGLVLKGGAWYLIAFSKSDTQTRTYRIASIDAITTLPGIVKRPRKFNLAQYWQASSKRFEADLLKHRLTVYASPRAVNWLKNERMISHMASEAPTVGDDQVDADSTQAVHPPKAIKGWRTVIIEVESIERGARLVLNYAGELIVLEPLSVLEKVNELVRTALELNNLNQESAEIKFKKLVRISLAKNLQQNS
jgi:predicted DNA-binding transcriptional regulator YafY